MNKFSSVKAMGYGLVLWAIMLIIRAVIIIGFNITLNTALMLLLAIIAGIIAYFCSTAVIPKNPLQAFGYGATFALVSLCLDLLFTRLLEPDIFAFWSYWTGYLLVMMTPFLLIKLQATGSSSRSSHGSS